jgi:hypothetical protein
MEQARLTSGTTSTSQNGTTTTTNGYAPSIPIAPNSAGFSAPTNVGVASSDILAEQVQLNSQITTLRLLLLVTKKPYPAFGGRAKKDTKATFTVHFPHAECKEQTTEERLGDQNRRGGFIWYLL